MGRLKEAVRACRQHNQRVQLAVHLQGIKTRDKTGTLLLHDSVHRISFISQDTGDARAVAYIYVSQDSSFHYIAIKAEQAVADLEAVLVALFQVAKVDEGSRLVGVPTRVATAVAGLGADNFNSQTRAGRGLQPK
ncbi:hypothetical protein V5799_012471 [Amblyomma americanum]|uniref:Uncharacterized protein n=1 Tax=Amblyomma americanum TaxID=6943 RepID=A0AAQ4EDZ0_AMBAM